MANHAGGISLVAFIIAVALSMGYYQFIYLPEANAKPIISEEIREPKGVAEVTIVDGASLPSNPKSFDPKDVRATLGLSNKVVWTNKDTILHTVTSDDSYKDAYSGAFNSLERPEEDGGAFVMPGETYEFLFTKPGEYAYHCEPHPHMKGKVVVVENFS